MTAAERARYAVHMAAASLRRSEVFAYAPLTGGWAEAAFVPGPGLLQRLLQAPRVLQASWRAAGEV